MRRTRCSLLPRSPGPPGLSAQQADSRLTLANYLDLEDVQNPVLSDGRQIISSPPVGG